MIRPLLGLFCTAIVGTGLLVGAAPQERTRTIYVSAVDNKNVPVTDLTPADFTVKEEGKERVIKAAAVATTPMEVALMVDNSGLGLENIREGLAAFVSRVRGRGQIAIVTTAGRNQMLMDFTADPAQLINGINQLFVRNATGAYLLDGIMTVSKTFTTRGSARPVIVMVALPTNEFSNTNADDVLEALRQSRAQLYVIELGSPVVQGMNSGPGRQDVPVDESARRNSVLGSGPRQSGGRAEQVVSATGMPSVIGGVADELVGQYAITYVTPGDGPATPRLSVETKRRGVRVRAPQRAVDPVTTAR